MRFSAATTAGRLLPQRWALRMRPLLGRIDAVLFTADERGQAGRMSLIAFSIRIVSAVIAFVSQVLMARWMGSFEYGIFVLVWVTMVIVGNLACLGFHTSVIRFIPEYRERGMLAELRGIVLASRLFVIAASTLIAGLGALGVWLCSGWIEAYYVIPFILGMICLPMIAMGDLLQGLARANSWALFALSPTYLVRPVLILVFMAAMLALNYAPDAKTAIFASIAATYVTTLGQLIGVTSRMQRKVPAGPMTVHFGRWFLVSLPIFLVESFFFLLTNADVLMVGAYLDPNDVAVYFATVKTLALVHFVYFAVKAGVAQRYAQFTHGEPERLAAFARETVSWTFWPSLAMALLVLVLGEPMLVLFGPEFTAGYRLLFLLVLGVVARAAVGPCESLLTMSGNQNICAAVYAMTLALNIGLNVMLIPFFGLWGAAIATSLAMVFEASALSFTVWRKLGIVMAVFVPAKKETA
ncbi:MULTISPECIES: lipopolysaccharide biosynthesis protein [unclassified Mesorhizobium]|uniref:lipopolysaccharide biosynthesis protein n=1 Tax=unclassified Mesorhizobium TaxID=325217 RepID=UPI000BAF55D9|nr:MULTISPECIES: lipopolysaccharide biosynthesis protein [unclassified Mesorhizobium]TGT63553.1 lipopolysaccharide biosynthesis protein [Mesorhizobium sp. M00.F.Ca.ET.170.01.1.1]AZO11360.1 lipopolysaccharide biosynthesis protein [Mesorhizobium sp. M3A.F.Ca.ET.080.04.2.1]PBB88382.1 multi antimicrobial extrusion protein MatE [Mesorhizobium sp. WSM3876]RWB76679.1 MAG: lipopolysaccharide biosynthesis protein [Mesorhizobium sp.]RWB92144.1 MAG: lipopolysaccharide biosynthesis protein [Mesorhizobium 